MKGETSTPPRISPRGWALLFMLVMASVLFFVDRKSLAILKNKISDEFLLSNENYSLLVNAYLIPYTIGYMFSGQLIDRWGTRCCAVLFLVGMSLATVGCGLARNFHELAAAQVMLGLSESGVVPCIMLMIMKWYPAERRGFVVTLHQALQSLGPVLTPPFVVALTLVSGWRASFIIPGVLSFALAAVWLFFDDKTDVIMAKATSAARTGAPGIGSLKCVLTTPALRGILLARIVTDPAWFFLLYWQEPFLQERGGWTLAQLGWTWMPPAVAAGANIFVGIWSDRLMRKCGHAPTARRIALQRLALFSPCFAIAPFVIGNKPAVLAMLIMCYVMANVWLTLVNVLITEVAPAGTVATALGALSAFGGAASIAFNCVAGMLVEHLGYATMFIACACLHPVGAVILWRYYGKKPAQKNALLAERSIGGKLNEMSQELKKTLSPHVSTISKS